MRGQLDDLHEPGRRVHVLEICAVMSREVLPDAGSADPFEDKKPSVRPRARRNGIAQD